MYMVIPFLMYMATWKQILIQAFKFMHNRQVVSRRFGNKGTYEQDWTIEWVSEEGWERFGHSIWYEYNY